MDRESDANGVNLLPGRCQESCWTWPGRHPRQSQRPDERAGTSMAGASSQRIQPGRQSGVPERLVSRGTATSV